MPKRRFLSLLPLVAALLLGPGATVASANDPGSPAGGTVWDSGVVGGPGVVRDVPGDTPWVSDSSYTAWGRVQQTGGAWSAWASWADFP